jgi:hypothetical protein
LYTVNSDAEQKKMVTHILKGSRWPGEGETE